MSQPTSSPPPEFVPDAVLSFTIQDGLLSSNWSPPSLTIDGHPVDVPTRGTRLIPVTSGRHHLRAHAQFLRRYGHATLDIDVRPGDTLKVFYAPPYQYFINDGSMGLSPQTRKGRGLLIAVWVVLGLGLLSVFGLIVGGLPSMILTALSGG